MLYLSHPTTLLQLQFEPHYLCLPLLFPILTASNFPTPIPTTSTHYIYTHSRTDIHNNLLHRSWLHLPASPPHSTYTHTYTYSNTRRQPTIIITTNQRSSCSDKRCSFAFPRLLHEPRLCYLKQRIV